MLTGNPFTDPRFFPESANARPKFLSELKRRNVYKVAVAYAIVGWLLIQVTTATFPVLEFPAWSAKLVIVLVVLGFPAALILAWAFELTPEGALPNPNPSATVCLVAKRGRVPHDPQPVNRASK